MTYEMFKKQWEREHSSQTWKGDIEAFERACKFLSQLNLSRPEYWENRINEIQHKYPYQKKIFNEILEQYNLKGLTQ